MDVLHTAIRVSDLEKTKEFYHDGLGLEYSRDFTSEGVKNYFVSGPDETEIQFKYDLEEDQEVVPSGIDHIAVSVNDIKRKFQLVTNEFDSSVVEHPTEIETTNSTVAFITDPDGYTIELIEP